MSKEYGIIYTGMLVLAASLVSQASIVGYTNNFTTAGSTNGWGNRGAVNFIITRQASARDYNDGDPTAVLNYTVGMELTGDGLYADGGLLLNTQDAIISNECAGYTLSGTMNVGETVTFSGCFYNDTVSFNNAYAQIWNVTDDRLLASTANILISSGNNTTNYVPVDFTVAYTGTTEEAGDVIEIRFLERNSSISRDVRIDNVTVTSIR